MKNFIPTQPKPVFLPIRNSKDQFPVRRLYCVGRNYAEHVREMGGDPNTSSPIFFTKSRETIVRSGTTLPFPLITDNLHHEVELVIAMQSATQVFGYGVGLDMTRRDLQAKAKSKGAPWDMAKNFDHSAPCSTLVRASEFDGRGANISLRVNNQMRQHSTLDHMIWSVHEIISHLNTWVELQAGDLIYSGTPDGVGPVKSGDRLEAHIDGLAALTIHYA